MSHLVEQIQSEEANASPTGSLRAGSIPHLHIGSIHHGPELLPQVEVVEEFIHDDAEKLRCSFKNAFEKVYHEMRRPHVLIAGNTGAGKSSIINTVFGSEIAKEGAGRPITQNFTKYCPDKQPIVLFDSKGLEAGMQFDEFLLSTREFFHNNEEDIGAKHLPEEFRDDASGLEKRVHLVWYVVNAAGARFQDFEERICRELFGRLPIIFILNKCDISTREQLDKLREVLEAMELPNCIGIKESVTAKFNSPIPPACCSKCKSVEDLVVINRAKMAICENCGEQTPFTSPSGLNDVIQLTFDTLPSIAKEAFVAAQRLSFKMKDQRARRIISEFYEEQNHAFTPQGLSQIIAKMLTRLSLVWDFRDHGHLYATHIAKDMMSTFSLRDKIFLFVHKNKHQKNRATAIGVIWNRSVRELAKIVLVEAAESVSESKIEEHWHLILEDCFHGLNDEELDKLEEKLADLGLEKVLDEEVMTVQGKPVGHSNSINMLLGHDGTRSNSTPNAIFSRWEGFLSSDTTPYDSRSTTPYDSAESSPASSPETSPRKERTKRKHKRHRSKGSRKKRINHR